jgi:hypothetical protein
MQACEDKTAGTAGRKRRRRRRMGAGKIEG